MSKLGKTQHSRITFRLLKNQIFGIGIVLLSLIPVVPLCLILYFIIHQGIGAINWTFFTELPAPVGETGGGIANALVGTLILAFIALIISVPIGIATGVYLSENRNSTYANWVRNGSDVLLGIPSIVIGIVVYFAVVRTMGSFSALSGGIALGIMMLPLIVKATEETLIRIPEQLKEASHALGVPHYKTVLKVLLPAGIGGILTGILLGLSRIAGETAPLLFTAFGNPFMSVNILKPVHSLPLLIYNYAISPYEEWHSIAWGASFVLVSLVLFINVITKIIARKWKTQF